MRAITDIRAAAASGRPSFGTFLVEMRASGVVHVLVRGGFDFVMIDCEHGMYDLTEITRLIQTTRTAGGSPWVRVPAPQEGIVGPILDVGAEAIIFPQIRTIEQVQRAVALTKYPPQGMRGLHLNTAHTDFNPRDDITEFAAEANRQIMTIVQVETAEAAGMVDQIASVEGLDAIYLGPGDLSMTMGHPGNPAHPDVQQVIRETGEACRRHGKIAATHFSDTNELPQRMAWGYTIFGWRAALMALKVGVDSLMVDFAHIQNSQDP